MKFYKIFYTRPNIKINTPIQIHRGINNSRKSLQNSLQNIFISLQNIFTCLHLDFSGSIIGSFRGELL
tara:strand:- start:580 stop:783 length:204 start_codon:yes stop_codon:yes gene_type:complete